MGKLQTATARTRARANREAKASMRVRARRRAKTRMTRTCKDKPKLDPLRQGAMMLRLAQSRKGKTPTEEVMSKLQNTMSQTMKMGTPDPHLRTTTTEWGLGLAYLFYSFCPRTDPDAAKAAPKPRPLANIHHLLCDATSMKRT